MNGFYESLQNVLYPAFRGAFTKLLKQLQNDGTFIKFGDVGQKSLINLPKQFEFFTTKILNSSLPTSYFKISFLREKHGNKIHNYWGTELPNRLT